VVRSMAYHSIGSAVLLAPFGIAGFAAVELEDVGLLAAGTLVLGALAGIAYLRGLAGIGATRAALLTFCEPVVAVLVGTLVWGEPLRAPALLGAALVIGAGVAVARGDS
jgi:drug/metabolite transporter (DMT)-like permease